MKIEIKQRVFLNLNQNIKFEEYYNCLFGVEDQKNVIIILFDLLIMKCIFEK